MKSAKIVDTERFTLTSYGNGLAYELRNDWSGESVFMQGDDAAAFRDEWEAMEDAAPTRPTDEIMAELFFARSE